MPRNPPARVKLCGLWDLGLAFMPVLFQNSVERSYRFSVVMAEDSAESFASRDRA